MTAAEAVWRLLNADPAFVAGMRRAQEDYEAGRFEPFRHLREVLAMTEPRDEYVGEGGDGTDPSLPDDAPLPADEPEQDPEPTEEQE